MKSGEDSKESNHAHAFECAQKEESSLVLYKKTFLAFGTSINEVP